MRNVPKDFLKYIRPQINRYVIGIYNAHGGDVEAICCILSNNAPETKMCLKTQNAADWPNFAPLVSNLDADRILINLAPEGF